MDKANSEQLRSALQNAVIKCSERCLYQSAKWAAELAVSLPNSSSSDASFDTDTDSPMRDADVQTNIPAPFTSNSDPQEVRLETREYSRYILAKSYFDCREFDRCANVFLPQDPGREPLAARSVNPTLQTPTKLNKGKAKDHGSGRARNSNIYNNELPVLSQKSLFLALYAKYMSGEKRKDEESEMILGPSDGGSTINRELVGLTRILEAWFAERTAKGQEASNQGWLEYLYGLVLAKGKTETDAKRWLIRSIHLFPFNWGAWLELSDLLGSLEELLRAITELPQSLMTVMFHLYASQELYQSTEAIHHELSRLENIFPDSLFLKTQKALLYYHSKDFEEAESIFSTILQTDPYRIDSLDHYSNILYVMGARSKLAFLAQIVTVTDKFRPETCCVIGNYYSLKSEHEKAVIYFRRALTLDRTFLSAWTLMGHEYIEMKNTHAAIESYRRAVDVNRKDYRAWFGIGQAYEFLEMHLYSLFYFQRAAALRPYDPKMWFALGKSYDKIERPVQSIKAYKRALIAGSYYDHTGSGTDSQVTASFGSSQGNQGSRSESHKILDPETLFAIATLYEKLGDLDEAASYMEMTLAQEEGALPASSITAAVGEEDDSGDDSDEDKDAESDDDSLVAGGNGDGHGEDENQARGPGTGVTTTTSRARMWLARWAFAHGDSRRAMELANELCEDGVEVEEAKALIRDLRARMEAG